VPLAERKEILDTCVLIAHSNWHSLATYVNYHSTEYQLRMGDSSFYYTLFFLFSLLIAIFKSMSRVVEHVICYNQTRLFLPYNFKVFSVNPPQ